MYVPAGIVSSPPPAAQMRFAASWKAAVSLVMPSPFAPQSTLRSRTSEVVAARRFDTPSMASSSSPFGEAHETPAAAAESVAKAPRKLRRLRFMEHGVSRDRAGAPAP